ncbi:MAG: ATP-binding cassette domain-containing protein [Oscillospiraceae bacterium]|nr:ATP-binding cassette domain-containing protein [Oscillospiraceae bacterium]
MEVTIKNLSKTIKGARVIDDISLQLTSGKIYGLAGKNGSGKTMLMRAICGLIRPTNGTVEIGSEVLGKDISFPRSCGVLIENPAFITKYTGFKNLQVLASLQNKITDEEIKNAIKSVGLEPDDKRTYRKYSLGMKQRLGIACAIMESPDLIMLDEPVNALDESGIELIREILASLTQKGKLIIISCHDKEELELLSDEIYYLSDGKIVNHVILNKEEKLYENSPK